MLHDDTRLRLCRARALLRAAAEPCRSVRQVACDVGISPYHFIRLFKATFGETPKQCQLRARLERARTLLAETDASVTEICLEAGFASLGSFSHAFARRVGMAPSAYRRHVRSAARGAAGRPSPLVAGCFSLMCARPAYVPQHSRSNAPGAWLDSGERPHVKQGHVKQGDA